MYEKHIIDRFWSKVEVREPEECWEWQWGRDECDYGIIRIDNKKFRAHRFVYQLQYGEIPKGVYVCHSCDNPPCCNPSHLWLGTQDDNMKDMVAKERSLHRHGSSNPFAKLNEETVREIRNLSESGISSVELSRRYGVTAGNIGHIVRRRAWKHI